MTPTLAEAAAAIAAKRLSPVELTEMMLARIVRLNPQLDAFLHVAAGSARAAARTAEAEIMAGRYRGALHGIPVGLKDIIDVAGMVTTGHSRVHADNLKDRDAGVTARLRAAGAVVLGKLATHEFAFGGGFMGDLFPPARNPWNRERIPGGSSSGSGAAVAAGLALGALGTDTGGSIRHPSGHCGLVGLKPTRGLVGRSGIIPLSQSLDNCGPMARTAEDCAILLQAIAGQDPADPDSAERPVEDFRASLRTDLKGVRVGVMRAHYTDAAAKVAPAVIDALESAIGVLRDLGAEVEDAALPGYLDMQACGRVILLAEAYRNFRVMLRDQWDLVGDVVRDRLIMGAFIPSVDYLIALDRQRRLTAEADAALGRYDMLVSPANAAPPTGFSEVPRFHFAGVLSPTIPFNVTGHPALSVPCGFTGDGLPIGMQLAGRRWRDGALLGYAHAYQQATPWKDRHPAMAA